MNPKVGESQAVGEPLSPVSPIKHLAHLPNTEGFRFIGIRHDGSRVECAVYRTGHMSGYLYQAFEYETGKHIYAELAGWRPLLPDAAELSKGEKL